MRRRKLKRMYGFEIESGFAAAHSGKALPYRRSLFFQEATPLL